MSYRRKLSKMNLTKSESNLIALALNVAAKPGEIDNAAVALIRSLRRRNVAPSQFATTASSDKLRIEMLTAQNRNLEHTVELQAAQIIELKSKSDANKLRVKIKQLEADILVKLEWSSQLLATINSQELGINALKAQIKQLEDVLSKHTKRIVQLERELSPPSPGVTLPFSKPDEWTAQSMCFSQ
jgi:hypothetical protein